MSRVPIPPTDFLMRWGAYAARQEQGAEISLFRFAGDDERLSEEINRFLVEIGLPSESPFRYRDYGRKKHVYEVFGPPWNSENNEWSATDRTRLQSYLVLGETEGGDPVCVDTANQDSIVLLNHERSFALAEFVNSSVWQLAESILLFEEMIEEYQREFGAEAELYEGNVPTQLIERTLHRFGEIDPAALQEWGYWPVRLQDI